MARPNHPKAGPGLPKGYKFPATLEREAARQIFNEEIRKEWRDIIRAQMELAKGIAVIDKTDSGGERIFDRPPSEGAGKNLMEQYIGKLPTDIDVMSGGEKLAAPIIQYLKPNDQSEL